MIKRAKVCLTIAVVMLLGCGNEDKSSQETTSSTPQIKVTQNVIKETDSKSEKSKQNSGQFYYTYNKEKNSTKEQKVRTTLDAYLNIRSPYERVQVELMINRLSRDFIIKCSPCHDDYANGVIGPSLLGKSGDFIYGRIMDFKNGKKSNVLMKELVAKMDDAKLKSIADEIAKFNAQIQELRKGRK